MDGRQNNRFDRFDQSDQYNHDDDRETDLPPEVLASSFNTTLGDQDVTFLPMEQFLNSDAVEFHPSQSIPMNIFFKHFTQFCLQRGYISYRKKYGPLWKRHGITCAMRKLKNQPRRRFLMGITVHGVLSRPMDTNVDTNNNTDLGPSDYNFPSSFNYTTISYKQ